MSFLTIDQMKTHIYPGVRDVISQGDLNFMQDAIDAAIDEAKGYCSRYDVETLFNSGTPQPMLLNWVKSIAKWNFITLANPNIDTEDAHLRYDIATTKLKDIQSGKLVPHGWPMATPEKRSQLWQVKSSPKRNNHFNSLNPYNQGYNQ